MNRLQFDGSDTSLIAALFTSSFVHRLQLKRFSILQNIDRVLIIGAGWVGRQVAARLAMSGVTIGLIDRSSLVAEQAYQWMQTCVTQANSPLAPGSHTEPANYLGQPASNPSEASIAAEAFDRPWLQFVSTLPAMQDLTKEQLHQWQPDLAIECVPEQLSLKKRVLRQLSDLLPDKGIIASNSSYFVPSVLSQFVRLPERIAHLHFHVPVLRQSVADIVGCSQTRPEVLQQLRQLAERIEQYPLMLRHEHPGYVFNWLLQAVLKAALELVALDVVDSDDVDRSWKAVTGMQVGPFGMMDQIGLDVIDQVLSNARWAVPPTVSQEQLLAILRPLVEKGKLGIKSGAGFYDYQKPSS
jgi:3-hydroxybutyryl-CoA dehydrogenase